MTLGVLNYYCYMSSYDPDDHFKLSRTSVGHSESEL